MADKLLWERDGADWPHRDNSRFVNAAGLRWHVQTFGEPREGLPVALLIHGTGASTHSWRGLAPLLAPHFRVVSMDLPGHGFTDMPSANQNPHQLSLTGMAEGLDALLKLLDVKPALVVGHSAGAAIAVRMCLDQHIAPWLVVALNGAFLPIGGLAGQLFSPVARLMAATPVVPRLFSLRASDPSVLQKLIDGTGSTLDETGIALYGKLTRNAVHAAGALGMMARWDLSPLLQDIHRLQVPVCAIVGSRDQTVSPRQAGRWMAKLPAGARAGLVTLPELGHLAHEEKPALVMRELMAIFSQQTSIN